MQRGVRYMPTLRPVAMPPPMPLGMQPRAVVLPPEPVELPAPAGRAPGPLAPRTLAADLEQVAAATNQEVGLVILTPMRAPMGMVLPARTRVRTRRRQVVMVVAQEGALMVGLRPRLVARVVALTLLVVLLRGVRAALVGALTLRRLGALRVVARTVTLQVVDQVAVAREGTPCLVEGEPLCSRGTPLSCRVYASLQSLSYPPSRGSPTLGTS